MAFLIKKIFTFITVAVKFSKFSSTKVLLQSMTYLNFQVVVKEACFFNTHAVKYSKFSNIGIQYQFSKNLNFQLEDLKIFSLLPQIPQMCISTMPVWPGTLLEHS